MPTYKRAADLFVGRLSSRRRGISNLDPFFQPLNDKQRVFRVEFALYFQGFQDVGNPEV